jgi:ABC-2 type transport system ATP-binding protein
LWEDLTIRENLDFVARMYRVPDRAKVVRESVDALGLSARRDQLAGQLSGGWKQRLSLAACMLHRPQLLLLDEPTAGVDPKARRDFWDQIHELAGQGIAVLVSTHYMDEAERCHELAYIAFGKLLVTGSSSEVIAKSGLATWSIEGRDLIALSGELERAPGVEMVVPFGTALHVSGTDATTLEHTMATLAGRPGATTRRIDTGLEDVFIHLMRQAAEPLTAPSGESVH